MAARTISQGRHHLRACRQTENRSLRRLLAVVDQPDGRAGRPAPPDLSRSSGSNDARRAAVATPSTMRPVRTTISANVVAGVCAMFAKQSSYDMLSWFGDDELDLRRAEQLRFNGSSHQEEACDETQHQDQGSRGAIRWPRPSRRAKRVCQKLCVESFCEG